MTVTVKNGTGMPAKKLRLRSDILYSKVIPELNRLVLVAAKVDPSTGKWINRGRLIGIDIKTGRIAFVRKTVWPDVQLTSQAILLNAGTHLQAFSVMDGGLLWEKKRTTLLYANDSLHFWISQTGAFYNIRSGEQQWPGTLPGIHAVEDAVALSPDTLLISASGLHWIQLQQGLVHTFPAITEKPYPKGSAENTVMIITGIMAGALSGMPMYVSVNAPTRIIAISSNVLVDPTHVYYASRDSLVQLSRSGERRWAVPLAPGKTGLQYLIDLGDRLGYLNSGRAVGNTRTLTTGSPAFAVYHKANGQVKCDVALPNEEGVILDTDRRGDTVLLLLPHHVASIQTAAEHTNVVPMALIGLKHPAVRFIKTNEACFTLDKTDGRATALFSGEENSIRVMDRKTCLYRVDARTGTAAAVPGPVYTRVYQSAVLEVYSSTAETCFLSDEITFCLPERGSVTKTEDTYIFTGKRSVYLFPNHTFDP